MTTNEAIKILEVAKAECEWNAPLEYQEAFDLAIEALEMVAAMGILDPDPWENYGLSGAAEEALRMAISALEKRIPKETIKPASPYFKYACPTCGNYPLSGKYCCECGQAVVYSKEGKG